MTHYAFFIILHLYSRHSIDAAVKEINLMVKHFKTTTNLFFFFSFFFHLVFITKTEEYILHIYYSTGFFL